MSVAAADQLQASGVSTYQLQPGRGVVHVTIDFTLTNRAPTKSRTYDCSYYGIDGYGNEYYVKRTCRVDTLYYYISYSAWIEKDARAVKATSGGTSLAVSKGKTDGEYRSFTIKFPKLFYGKTRKIRLAYDLPAGGPRTVATRRVGYVYSSFCAVGPGSDTGRLLIEIPSGYVMNPTATMTARTSNGQTTFDSGSLKTKPWDFYTCLKGSDPTGYAETPVTEPSGDTVTVDSWKEDATWATGVKAAASDLPALRTVLGEPPHGSSITIREGPPDSVAGYDTLSGELILSEDTTTRAAVDDALARMWFPDTSGEPWLTNGYIAWAEHQAGISATPCSDPGPYTGGGSSSADLARWSPAPLDAEPAEAALATYQRQAACFIVDQLATAIGTDRMTATMAAMRDGTDGWSPSSAPSKRSSTYLDWNDWLDLVTERGLIPAGADPDLASDLLLRFGVTRDDKTLGAHSRTRDRYHALLALLGGKPAPSAVTAPLAAWKLDDADAAIAAATSALTKIAAAKSTLPALDVDGGPVEQAVLGATSQADLDAASASADTQDRLASEVADAEAVSTTQPDPIQALGLIGTTTPDPASAVAAVGSIDQQAADADAAALKAPMDGARDAGLQRLAIAGLAILLVLVAIAAVVLVRRRRSRRSGPGSGPGGTDAGGGPSDADAPADASAEATELSSPPPVGA